MKSYFANSFQAAMGAARQEMGPDAVLVTSRPTSGETRSLGGYEVVCASGLPKPEDYSQSARDITVARAENRTSPSPESITSSGRSGSGLNNLASREGTLDAILTEMQELRRQLRSSQQANWRSSEQPRWIASSPELRNLYGELMDAEVDPDLAQQLLGTAIREPEDSTGATEQQGPGLLTALTRQIRTSVRLDSGLGGSSTGARVVALIGPPGAGKTATIAKIAVQFGLPSRRPTVILSVDTLRVGASEQLRTYASIMGLRFEVIETSRGLDQALEEHRGKGLILVDTPGFAFRDLEGGCELAGFLAQRNDIQKHLVLPGSMRCSDMNRMSAAYEIFAPSHLIFTRMDETETFGPVLNEAIGSGRPLSFFGTGQHVPEDLESANHAGLLNRLLRSQASLRTAAAAA